MGTIISYDASMAYARISFVVLMGVNIAMMFFGMYSDHGTTMLFLAVIIVWVGSLVVVYVLVPYERRRHPSQPNPAEPPVPRRQ